MKEPDIEIWIDTENEDDMLLDPWNEDDGLGIDAPSSLGAQYGDSQLQLSDVAGKNTT